MVFPKRQRGFAKAVSPTVLPETIPASIGGINALDSLAGMPPQDCIFTYNLMPSEYGIRTRLGYREWATGVPSDVRSIIPYDHQGGDNQKDKLFAVCAEGIYDITLFGTTAPVQAVPFASNGFRAGYGVHVQFTADNGDKYILYADEENGLWYYNGQAETWSQPALTFPDSTTVDDIVFVTTHKQRIWLISEAENDGYYLPIDSLFGNATKFNFGSKFPHGGRLMGLWSWSVDGGDGIDDFFVAVSKAGDVLVWYGPDPSQPQWSLRGSYYIGETPNSRRIAVEEGSELYLLSVYGITSVRDLLQGVNSAENTPGPASKVTRIIRTEVEDGIDSPEWQLVSNPGDGIMLLLTPWKADFKEPRQMGMNINTKAWGFWQDVPAMCFENWKNDFYIGGPDGVVYLYDGGLDGTTLSELGLPIEFQTLTSFQPYGKHGQNLKAGLVRTVGVTQGIVNINLKAVYDYDINNVVQAPASSPSQGTNLWDVGLWDIDLWDFEATGRSVPLGTAGVGRTMAVAVRGTCESRITIVAWDIMFQQGGLM